MEDLTERVRRRVMSQRQPGWPLASSPASGRDRGEIDGMHVFYNQVHDFCELMLEQIAKRLSSMPEPPASASVALAFTEKFLLCPTLESARTCIERDLPGALNFAMALDAANRRIQKGLLQLPSQTPGCQTRFYVLGSVVQQHLSALRRD